MSARRERLAGAVRRTSTVVDRLLPSPPGTTVLIYHRVGGTTSVPVDLPVDVFRRQMQWLAESGRVLTLADALDADPPAAPIVITFDDGTADWAAEAMPVLAEHALPAMFYVSTGFVDEQRMFPDEGSPISWTGLQEMSATGLAAFGSHTHTHRVLADADATVAIDEVARSKSLIEDRLGVACADFAYPKAIPGSAAAEVVVRRHFATAALAGSRPNPTGVDRHRLHRTPITVRDDMESFVCKANGGTRLEGQLRGLRDGLVRARSTLADRR